MIMTEKELLEERRLMDYTLLVTENLFREMYIILSELDQKTRSARITQTEVEYKGTKKIIIKEQELSTKELRAELDANNLIRTMEYVKSSLDVTDHLEYSDNLILALLKKLPHIEVEHYIKTLMDKKYELKQSLNYLDNKIENAQKQVSEKIADICDGIVKKIEFERTQIIVYVWSISFVSLENLKKELHLKDIIIKNSDTEFKLYLIWRDIE